MIRFTFAFLAAMVFFAGPVQADDKAKAIERDMKALQGVWLVEAAYQEGKQVPEKDRQSDEYCLYAVKVVDDKFQIAFLKNKNEYGNLVSFKSFKADPSSSPKVLEFVAENEKRKKEGVAYAIDGDKLTVCFQTDSGSLEKLPKTLETKPGDKLYLFVLKRMKDK